MQPFYVRHMNLATFDDDIAGIAELGENARECFRSCSEFGCQNTFGNGEMNNGFAGIRVALLKQPVQ